MDIFTDKELELIGYLVEGFSNKEIAGKMFLTTATVKAHMTSIMKKFGVKNRTAAAIIAVIIGIVDYRKIEFLQPYISNKSQYGKICFQKSKTF